jgi:4a-hydroxytetrahydrobiopterin dehydratase
MDWQEDEGKLTKEFSFDNFEQAMEFVNQIAIKAEAMQHHPDILIYDYSHVKVMIHTHTEEAITQKDYRLAYRIDEIKPE